MSGGSWLIVWLLKLFSVWMMAVHFNNPDGNRSVNSNILREHLICIAELRTFWAMTLPYSTFIVTYPKTPLRRTALK